MRALIIAAGDKVRVSGDYDMVIAADGGYDNALSLGICPDFLIGDMDSVKSVPCGIKTITLPVEKDLTDTEAAINLAIEKGAKEIDLVSAIGSRFDHSVFNMALLGKYIKRGVKVNIISENAYITPVYKKCEFINSIGKTVSFFPFGVAKGVTLSGFYYSLSGAKVELGDTLTISNKITSDKATVTVDEGILLAIFIKE